MLIDCGQKPARQLSKRCRTHALCCVRRLRWKAMAKLASSLNYDILTLHRVEWSGGWSGCGGGLDAWQPETGLLTWIRVLHAVSDWIPVCRCYWVSTRNYHTSITPSSSSSVHNTTAEYSRVVEVKVVKWEGNCKSGASYTGSSVCNPKYEWYPVSSSASMTNPCS